MLLGRWNRGRERREEHQKPLRQRLKDAVGPLGQWPREERVTSEAAETEAERCRWAAETEAERGERNIRSR